MNIAQIETAVQTIATNINSNTFLYDLLAAYGIPKATVKRLQGTLNLSKVPGETLWKKKLLFKTVTTAEAENVFTVLKAGAKTIKHEPRFIVVTDHQTLYALDTKTGDAKQFPLTDVGKHCDFFLPLGGMQTFVAPTENPADVKAAERMARLYDEIKKDNPAGTPEDVHNLNVFLSRLLFCFFAEDTDIFPKDLFTTSVASHTQPDGSDLTGYLTRLFRILNTEDRPPGTPHYLLQFPYVNGGLFRHEHPVPAFTRRSRQALIDAGSRGWKDINPDIFGSMIQAVVTPEHRGGMGMHYTSVPNIMKVIEPLFLADLNEEFEAAKHQPLRLNKLLERLGRIRIFDPACGSGNFLIIAYRELRLFEMKVLARLQDLQKEAVSGFEEKQLSLIPKAQLSLAAAYKPTLFSRIELHHFYGIELDDFAHEIAALSLWLAEHQMNLRFKEAMGEALPSLPLKAGGNIKHGNATRLDWEEVCPKGEGLEVYILGNPPYLGQKEQTKQQKADIQVSAGHLKKFRELDYIGCWFVKAVDYIHSNEKFAFVTTNSICQGSHVGMLWPYIFDKDLEIFFAVKNFKWSNNAKQKAAVICSIIGVRRMMPGKKFLFDKSVRIEAQNINAYLANYKNLIVATKPKPLSSLPEMTYGNQSIDDGHLLLSDSEKVELISSNFQIEKFIKPFIGSREFINGIQRWCIWIEDDKLHEAMQIEALRARIENVRLFRENAGESAQNYADVPYRFTSRNRAENVQIIVPLTSSERRKYIPIGFLGPDYIISQTAQVIYDSEPWIFGLITSHIHMIWLKTVGGRLKTDYRYSSHLCYNTFPFPTVNQIQKVELEQHVFQVLAEREKHSEKTLADLYDPDKMPPDLREAHRQLDLAVERCYRPKPFESDEERLEYLFKLYEKMIAEEKTKEATTIKPKKQKINTP